MSTPTPISASRAFGELASQSGHAPTSWVRARTFDGSTIEGQLLRAEPTQLSITDHATQTTVHVSAGELAALEVREPRRGREWMLAGAAIVGATAALIWYATLPWARRDGGIADAFKLLYVIGAALLSLLLARTGLRRWLTVWRSVYPPRS